jgi:hypothetical protein
MQHVDTHSINRKLFETKVLLQKADLQLRLKDFFEQKAARVQLVNHVALSCVSVFFPPSFPELVVP